ncbi:MAG: hypothetical protein BGO54_05270 [Sphingobacteriales bacterium 46-32]|nr:MAG: hypothetical protein BGO54_05270 [Sphingobacteriales bacterium 46-32]
MEKIAKYFLRIGAKAATNVKLHGTRGTHDIDVLVEFKQFRITSKWIIGCKLWKTALLKEKALTLQQIVQDVGRAFKK